MKDFLVSFFINSYVKIEKLSKLVPRLDSNLLYKEFFDIDVDLVFPVTSENGNYELECTAVISEAQISVNGEKIHKHKISHGDYLNIKNLSNELIYSALFIDLNKVNILYKKYKIENNATIFIGRSSENDICFDINNFISREKHAAIRVDSTGDAYIEDLKRSTGVYLNSSRTNSSKLSMFDEVYIMGLSMIYMGEFLAIRNLNLTCKLKEFEGFSLKTPINIKSEKSKYFIRTTRILKSLETGVVEIDPPAVSQKSKRLPLMLTMGPSLTMSIAMLTSLGFSVANLATGGSIQSVVTSGVMAASMLLGAFMWPSLMNSYQRRQEEADEKFRRDKYQEYIAKIDHELSTKYERNLRVWNEVLSPSYDALSEILDSEEKQLRLWERSVIDDDFLCVRVGNGQRELGMDINIPKQGFTLDDDGLYKLPQSLVDKYMILKNVPVTLNLRKEKTVGLIGKQINIQSIASGIILNIVALHSYDEVKIVFICNETNFKEYEWVRELPHVWSADRGIRYIATNKNEVHQIFNSIDEIVKERENADSIKQKIFLPNFLLFIIDPYLIENESLLRYIENSQNQVGISSLFLYGDISKLPKDCSTILQSDDTRTGYYSKNKNNNKFISFNVEPVNMNKLNHFANKLSKLHVKVDVKNLSIPNRVSFMQMYRSGSIDGLGIEQNWSNNASNKTLAAPIGVMAGGEVFSLDIHESYHGCHGLVAGMTGSGKSEFLQSYILSLAINYSPNEVAFVLVDFKGGDMARPFMAKVNSPAMPHLSATISNLSGNILYRALVSFEAEIKTRQRIFNESAATLGIDKLDINSYHRYFKEGKLKTPLPHLIIIIDEFAQLKSQQPDFLAQLINVAQVGRSLGIHLILATQKPSGVVDPQIWSNSRFKVCLKVLDKQDSKEMINRPEAAMIKLPGRCYVQVGYDEVFECLQSGYSGADYIPSNIYLPDDEITLHMVDNTATPIRSAKECIYGQKTDKTQLEEIVSNIVTIGVNKGLKVKPLWCELLKEKVLLNELGKPSEDTNGMPALRALVAMVDYVKTQQQLPLEIDILKTGHIALYGAAGTGKTTFIQTLVYSLVAKYSPEELNIYVLDFGGRALGYLNILPHCGGVIYSDNEDGVIDTIDLIQSLIDERKALFEGKNCSSYIEYLRATGQKLPAVVLVIDNYAPFREQLYHLEDSVVNLVSTGKTYGVFTVITGNSRNAIYYRVCEHISAFYILKMNDSMNYRDILNTSIPIEPENIKGRGITVIDENVVEFQVALAVDGENEAERVKTICRKFTEYMENWDGYKPTKIVLKTSVPNKDTIKSPMRKTTNSNFVQKNRNNPPDSIEDTPHTVVVGNSISGTVKYGIHLMNTKTLFVGVKSNNESKEYVEYLLMKISEHSKRQIILVDNEGSSLKDIMETMSSTKYINSSSMFSNFMAELEQMVNIRKAKYDELSDAGLSKDIIYGNMISFDKIFIVISDFKMFYDMITDEDAEKFTKIIKSCSSLGIYFITIGNLETLADYNQVEMYIYLVKSKDGVIYGGGIETQHAGLLCDEMIDIAVSQKVKAVEKQCLFYSNTKNVVVTF